MKISVGLSGGVDSSVAAAVLKQQGHELTGVFLECYRTPGCRVDDDRKDALEVALSLGIPFQVLDFKTRYKEKVLDLFFEELSAGRTPNPDIACNREIKFGLFYDWALEQGFDAVATGHYAAVRQTDRGVWGLYRSADLKKDQTYFLYQVRQDQLSHMLFPLASMQKEEVRALAEQLNLKTASKPDSTGICFIGEMDVKAFIRDRLGENRGEVVDTEGAIIGEHDGLWFYTIGQRHGFRLLGKVRSQKGEWKHVIPPLYVIGKDVEKNRLIVGYGAEAMRDRFDIQDPYWIDQELVNSMFLENSSGSAKDLLVRIRHGGQLYRCEIIQSNAHALEVRLKEKVRGVAPGQHAVLYEQDLCLGGGVLS